MRRRERAATAAQRESDHQRWADDGGFVPDAEAEAVGVARPPWLTVGVAAAAGFALGWLTAPPRYRGGR